VGVPCDSAETIVAHLAGERGLPHTRREERARATNRFPELVDSDAVGRANTRPAYLKRGSRGRVPISIFTDVSGPPSWVVKRTQTCRSGAWYKKKREGKHEKKTWFELID
jgi:hypothetical protein